MKKIFISLMAILLIIFAVSGCGHDGQAPDGSGSSEVKTNLAVSMQAEPQNLDPQYCTDSTGGMFVYQMFNRLVRIDRETGEVLPELAKSWKISDDGLVYTFNLRDDVFFSDGEKFDADDVVYTFERIDESPYCVPLRMAKSYRAVDDHTFEVTLNNPAGYFFSIAGNLEYSVVPRHVVEKVGQEAFNLNPVGTGSYKFVSWTSGEKVVLTYNDKYWGEEPKIKDIEFRKVMENTTVLANLESGQVDMVLDLSGTDMEAVENNSQLKLYAKDSPTVWYLTFNCQKEPFDDVNLRRAVSYVIDRQSIIDVARNGAAKMADTDIHADTAGIDGTAKEEYIYDVDKAKELMKEIGYENGFETVITARNDMTQLVAQVLQSQLGEIGITAEIQIMERGAHSEYLQNGGHELAIYGSSGGTMEANFEVPLFLHTSTIGSNNFSYYSNTEFDKLCDDAALLPAGEREKLYADAIELINRDLPRIPLFYPLLLNAAHKNLAGLEPLSKIDYILFNKLYWQQ